MFSKLNRIIIIFLLLFSISAHAQINNTLMQPVTPDALPETKALLELIYSVSGNYLLTGQHNFPNTKDRNTEFAVKYTGKTPAVFSTDWGHAREGDSDSYLARPDIVKECIRQHQQGSLITICWHAVPPTTEEPVTFRPVPGTPADTLKSVQGNLLDEQFKDLLTQGTQLYNQWCKQVDSVAKYLKQLEEAKVPVLWRPYHEMNGSWFWWGGQTGDYSTRKLYIQLFDRLINYHNLKNLVWVWSVDRFHESDMYYEQYFPGIEYLDILALDVYHNDFSKDYYDSLVALSQGKPLILAEVGNPPNPKILDEQPKWALYVTWATMVRNTLRKDYVNLFSDTRILNQEDESYHKLMNPYRKACNLNPLPLEKEGKTNFSGIWKYNEEKSTLDAWGSSQVPWKMEVIQTEEEIKIIKTNIEEFADVKVEEEVYKTDGSEHQSEFWNLPQITTARWLKNNEKLVIESNVKLEYEGKSSDMKTSYTWTFIDGGNAISVHMKVKSPWVDRDVIMVFEKEWYYPLL